MTMATLTTINGLLIYLPFFIFHASIYASCAQEPHSQSQQESEPSYLRFTFNASDFPSEDYYDYIIVGGGTAGCPLAATLSQKFKVLVLERGGIPSNYPDLMTQEGFLATLAGANTYDSPAQSFISEDGVPNARGRVLGGSSAINAGFYSRADDDFFANSGLSWNPTVVNKSYEWVEREIVFRPELKTWQSAVRDGLLEAGVGPYHGFSLDHAIGTKIGGSTFDGSGRRHSSADLLTYARAPNIRVAVYHHALTRGNGEVILCAGAIGSPQLLLLSGIGPRPYLSLWGIPVAHHLPYVGQYLYDNPRNGINIVPSVPLEHSLIQVVGITDSGAYIEASSNAIPFASSLAHSVFIGAPPSPLYLPVASLMEKIVGPMSSGFLRLASTDVRVNPAVRFNYLNDRIDVERCVNGTRKIMEVMRSRAMSDFRFRNWLGGEEFRYVGPALPANERNFGEMAAFCRRTVSTIWHYHGGCVVGSVVDSNLRVIGVHDLRVVDGSVFVESPGTNPQATLMMLGRYIGLKIMKERMRYK